MDANMKLGIEFGDPFSGIFVILFLFVIVFFILLLYALLKVYKYKKYGRIVYIFKGKQIYKTLGIVTKNLEDEEEFSLYTNMFDVLRNAEPKIHLKKEVLALDTIYLLQVGVNDYRYINLKLDEATAKLVYDDNEALAKEKFVKNMRLIASRFVLEDKIKKWLNIAAVLIAVIGILVLFSIISDTQQKIADKYVDVVKKQQEIQEKYANGTYLVDACRQIELQRYAQYQQSQGTVVINR